MEVLINGRLSCETITFDWFRQGVPLVQLDSRIFYRQYLWKESTDAFFDHCYFIILFLTISFHLL